MTDTHRVSRAARHGASARSQKCRLRTRREGASVRDSPRQGLRGEHRGEHRLPLAPRESPHPQLRLGRELGGSRRRRPVLHKPLPGPRLTAGRPRPRRQPATEAHRVHYAAEGAACARTLPTLSGAGQPEWPAGANPRARPRSDWLWPCVPAATPASASAPSPPLSWILGWPRSPGTSVCVDSRPLAVHKRVRPRLTRVTESTLKQRLTVQPAPGPSEVQHGTTMWARPFHPAEPGPCAHPSSRAAGRPGGHTPEPRWHTLLGCLPHAPAPAL